MLYLAVKSPVIIITKSKEELVTRFDEITGHPFNKTIKKPVSIIYLNGVEISHAQYVDFENTLNRNNLCLLGDNLVYEIDCYISFKEIEEKFDEFKSLLKLFDIQDEPYISYGN